MLQAVMSAPRKFTLREVPEPRITGEEECLLEVRACGICGSDMHPYLGEGFVSTYDRVPGHEFCGTVLEIKMCIRDRDKRQPHPAGLSVAVMRLSERFGRPGAENAERLFCGCSCLPCAAA